ncbi:hypothetical protein BH23CHL8_BH23CHL8_09970 [soil metagenome]
MVDDLGYLDNDRILKRLPNIRKLFLEGGMRFTRMYNEAPLCCPARANFQGGQHTLRNGVTTNTFEGFDTSRTLATALADVGYHTIIAGKYLNNYDGSVVPPGWHRALINRYHSVPSSVFWVDGRLTTFEGRFFDDVTRQKAVRWLGQAPRDRPVFELLTPYAPHRHRQKCGSNTALTCTLLPAVIKPDRRSPRCAALPPFKPPSYRLDSDGPQYPTKWPAGWPLETTCESLLIVDRMVGQLVKAQAERKRPAIFVFMSDNGMSWGQHGLPLKTVPWSTRLPFYVAGSGVRRGATGKLLSIIDVPVTLADYARAHMPWADGTSFRRLLQGRSFSGRSELLEIMPKPPGAAAYLGWEAIRTRRWRYLRWETGAVQLFDLVRDPWELRDLGQERAAKATQMDERLDRLLAVAERPARARRSR